jgi:recombination DNA repair RAD52 pathway protein
MRAYPTIVLAIISMALPARADIKSYCELIATDFATANTSDVDQWQLKFHNTFDDCMLQYNGSSVAAPEKKPVTAVKPLKSVAKKPAPTKLAQGSAEWNAYCAAKYTSFNKATGTYMSKTGVVRKCVVSP